jgi:putative DNA primase/helicase
VERLAKEVVRGMYELAALEPNDARRLQMGKHAAKSESAGKLAAMLELAKTEEGIAVAPEAFDANPLLFNVANGTLDLQTGELLPHRPEDMITNISPAEWRGGNTI